MRRNGVYIGKRVRDEYVVYLLISLRTTYEMSGMGYYTWPMAGNVASRHWRW